EQNASQFVTPLGVSDAQLAHCVFATTPDRIIEHLRAGMKPSYGNLLPPTSSYPRRQHAIFIVTQTQLSFHVATPAPQVSVHVDGTRVEGIERHLNVLSCTHADRLGARGKVARPQIAERVFSPTPELTLGPEPTAMVLAGRRLKPVAVRANSLRSAELHRGIRTEPELVPGVTAPAPQATGLAQRTGVSLARVHGDEVLVVCYLLWGEPMLAGVAVVLPQHAF